MKAFVLSVIAVLFTLSNGASLPNCSIVSENHIYDLSSLAERDYWSYEEKVRYNDFYLNFYFAVCHPIRNLPPGRDHCMGSNSGVCVEQLSKNETLDMEQRFMKVVIPNAGMITPDSLIVTNEGWLEYVYSNGTSCEFHGKKSNYKTYLNLLCPSSGAEESAGPVLMSNSQCELTFAWLTNAACAKKYNEPKITTCIDKFLDSNETLNLHTLHSLTYYNVSSASRTYQVNICGAIESGPCDGRTASVCDVTDPQNPKVISKTADMEVMWHDDYFALHYNANTTLPKNSQEKEVTIQFHCNRDAHAPTLHYLNSNETHITFAALTAAVCTPKEQECVLQDRKGHVYDLRPLHKKEENWEVLDRREDHRDILYHLNICGPVNEAGYYQCPLGNLGACQTSMSRHTAYNLGFITSNPVINADNSITVLYTGGDACHDGNHTRSTRLTLVCDKYEHEPMFVQESESCEYVFNWLTPVACPKHVVTSDSCQVQDPLFGFTYDISPLRNLIKDYTTSDGTIDFYVNVCGPVVEDYGRLPVNTSVAVKVGDHYQTGGVSPGKMIFNDGTITMEFDHGSSCGDNETISSQILFLCDHNSDDAGSGLSIFTHRPSCKYNFLWHTKYVCPPHTVIDCSVTTKDGDRYDLNPLSLPTLNQEETGTNKDEKFILNVCRSIVHSKDARCAYDAAACLVDESHKNKSVNIGVVGSGPYVENGHLRLKYVNGDLCRDKIRYTTEIYFECDPNDYFPYPSLITKEDCKYIFEWKTKFACAEKMSHVPNYGNCTAKDLYTNSEFNLMPLRQSDRYEIINGNVTLLLNVCGPVVDPRCPENNSGSCVKRNTEQTFVSGGLANANLLSVPGTLSLTYKDGSSCSNGFTRTTSISFFCGAENATNGPVLVSVDDNSCTYFVNWHTELACNNRVDCIAQGYERDVDLRPLIKHDDNYEVDYPNGEPGDKFFINVCRPLNHVIGTTCTAGASACLVKKHQTNGTTTTQALSLGKPLLPPNYGFDNSVMMLYTLGSYCLSTPGLKYTTKINFVCDRSAGKGTPTFVTFTHDCQYQFEWRTYIVCSPLPRDTGDDGDGPTACHIRHDTAKTNLDLTPLYKQDGYRVPFPPQNKVYHLNICGSVCGSSGVCTDSGENFGQSNISQFKWDDGELKLLYYGGDTCPSGLSGHRTSSIFFECDMNAGYGRPEPDSLMEDLECMAIFTWKTNITCLEAIYGDVSTTATTTILSSSTVAPFIPANSSNNTDRGTASQSVDEPPADDGGGLSNVTAVLVALMVVTVIVGAVLYAVRSGLVQRVVNRAKMATATPRYSSRHGGMMLLDDSI
uniref:Autophagy-related protein 27 n=1 Tax=Hirondellea gigas TaxID=1518452 RepID=A0A2P2ICE8_9CRUS